MATKPKVPVPEFVGRLLLERFGSPCCGDYPHCPNDAARLDALSFLKAVLRECDFSLISNENQLFDKAVIRLLTWAESNEEDEG